MVLAVGGDLEVARKDVSRGVVFFTVPLFLKGLFRRLCGATSSLVMKGFLKDGTLTTIDSSKGLVFLVMNFVGNVTVNTNIIVTQCCKTGGESYLGGTVRAAITFKLITNTILAILKVFLTPGVLMLVKAPTSILPRSVICFHACFTKSVNIIVCGVFIKILRSINSKHRPLVCLVVSSYIGIILSVFFVTNLNVKIKSTTLTATVSRFIDTLLYVIRLLHIRRRCHLRLQRVHFSDSVLGRVVRGNMPSNFRGSIVTVTGIFMRSGVGTFKGVTVTKYNSCSGVRKFTFLPIAYFAVTLAAFIDRGLNTGRCSQTGGKTEFKILYSVAVTRLVNVVVCITTPMLVATFGESPSIMRCKIVRSEAVTLFCYLLTFSRYVTTVLHKSNGTSIPVVIVLYS